jgi:two-component system sensor histidine kinase RpfC
MTSGPLKGELGHGVLRVVIGGIVTTYVVWSFGAQARGGFLALLLWLTLAVGLLLGTWIWPRPSVFRRVLGLISDVGIVTVALFYAEGTGAVIVSLYIWIILGAVFRYGRRYVYLTQCLSLAGLALAAFMVPWWRGEPLVALGWSYAIAFIPIYVSTLVERLKRQLAEQQVGAS